MTFFRSAPIAVVSLMLSIGMYVFAIVVLVGTSLLKHALSNETVIQIALGIWLIILLSAVWFAGPRKDPATRDGHLHVLHAVQGAFVALGLWQVILGSGMDFFDYIAGFVEFLILGALLIFGLICLRNRLIPHWPYWFYLIGNTVWFIRLLNRL
jgi:hypothetical protein